MRTNFTGVLLVLALLGGTLLTAAPAEAQRRARQDRTSREAKGEYAAYKLLKRGQELLEMGEEERGVKMLQTIIEQHPTSPIRFQAYLALGKHYLDARDQAQAIDYLRNIRRLEQGRKQVTGEDLELYLEGLYLTGVAHYQMRQYGATFSTLRRITSKYPDTFWANQAYYYIGMAHFAQSHWNKAIKALSMVGTFIDPDSPTLSYAEAGRRFHVRVTDADLPIIQRMGKKIVVAVETKGGDKETIVCQPAGNKKDVLAGSITTATGVVEKDDGEIQVTGGDSITVTYVDDNTKDGTKDVSRTKTVEVVSTGGVTFTLGTYESLAQAAYLGQPLFLRLWDLDQDKTADRDTASIRISSLYKPLEEEEPDEPTPSMTIDVDKLLAEEEEEEQLLVRDEVVLKVSETGELPLRTGIFIGSVPVERFVPGQPADKTDQVLAAEIGDEIVAVYVDERHILGTAPVEISAKLSVAGEIDSTPRAAQDVVPDPLVKARKELVEAEAFLELAKIFKDMGLTDGAKDKAQEGLDRVEAVIRASVGVPSRLKETAFRIKWELHLAEGDFPRAMATCHTFNRLYPESPLVDRALMGIGEALREKKDYDGAIAVLRQVTQLPNSHSKARAQYLVAQVVESRDGASAAAGEYMACAQRFPDSEQAGPSLAKVIDFQVKSKNYSTADDLLEQIFVDYQDEDFLDEMLLKWVVVAYNTGDFAKAKTKCDQLISEYPGSPAAAKAEKALPKIEAALGEDKETDEGEEQ